MFNKPIYVSFQVASFLIFLLLSCQTKVIGQEMNSGDFKRADLRSGTLKNGLRYYIMENNEPQDRAAFYFAQNVGSILEEEDQRGLAHFLEHMAFNGTKHFPDKEMLDYLQKNGIKFGSEINAFTDYDETVYSIRNVPVHNTALLDSVLLMLFDWSGELTLSGQEIDNERGVVREEWRSRFDPVKRAADSVKMKGLLKDSRYAIRAPIGTMEVIDNFEHEVLRSYYEKWYRPDLQAVIIVGAIDAEKIEQKVQHLFSERPIAKDLPERPSFEVPLGEEFTYLTIADKELGTTEIEYFIKHKVDRSLNEKKLIEKNLKFRIISSLLNQRLQDIINGTPVPVLSVHFGLETVVRPLEVMKFHIQPKKGMLMESLDFVLTELNRWATYGATELEFDRIKSSMIPGVESSLKSGKGRSSVYTAIKLYEAFLKEHELPDYGWEQQYELEYLTSLTHEDLLQEFLYYYQIPSQVVAVKGPDSTMFPTEEAVFALLESTKKSMVEPFLDIKFDKALIDLDLIEGEVVSEEAIEGTEGIRFTLSNGARVSLFPSPVKEEGVHFKAFSSGGRSVLDQNLLTNALFAPLFAIESGLANLNKMELRKSDEVVPLAIQIEEYEESLTGYVAGNNLNQLFKGIYLSFMAPRFEDQIFDKTKQSLESLLAANQGIIQSDLIDSLQMAWSNYSDRKVYLNRKLIDDLSLEVMETIYRDRISNASDFDFVFMGELDKIQFIELAKKYIGSIPGNLKKEYPIDHDMKPAVGMDRVHIQRPMLTPQATVNVYMTGAMDDNHENRLGLEILGQLLSKLYMKKIREEEGGTYGVRVTTEIQHNPEDNFVLNISFNGNPYMTETLLAIVYQELENLTHTIDKAALHEVKSSLKKEMLENRHNSRRHFEKILKYIKTGLPLLTVEEESAAVDELTEAQIFKIASIINENPRIVEGILSPL